MRLVVPFTPGGSQDVIARLFAQKLTGSFRQQVVIDNRGGAAGLIAAELVARAPPDGYTLFLITGGLFRWRPRCIRSSLTNGSISHLTMEALKHATGITLQAPDMQGRLAPVR